MIQYTKLHLAFGSLVKYIISNSAGIPPNWNFPAPHIENMIYLPGQSGDVLSFIPSLTERMMFMVSWNDLFTFIIMMIAILTYIEQHGKHKK